MGFRKEAYATVWEIEPISDTRTKGRISISKKNRSTGEYETDFNGYVSFIGTVAAKNASQLKERDRIKLGDIDVSNKYDAEKKVTYTNFKIFSFETQNANSAVDTEESVNIAIDSGELGDELPF